jgi:hypothetical protein
MEGVVAAQVQEASIPDHLVPLAAGDDRAKVVVAHSRGTPSSHSNARAWPLEKRLDRHVEAKEGGLRARVGQAGDERVDAPLPTGHPRPRRQLRPVKLLHLPRPVASALRRPHRPRPQLAQPPAHEIDRPRVAVVGARQLRRPRRLDLRPLLEQPPQHRLEPIQLRAGRRAPIARRLLTRRQPRDRAPVDRQPPRDLPLRQPVRRQCPHPCPLQRSPHLPPPRLEPITTSRACEVGRSDQRRREWRLFAARSRCSIGRRASVRLQNRVNAGNTMCYRRSLWAVRPAQRRKLRCSTDAARGRRCTA